MTKVLNKQSISIEVFAKNGDSIMIPKGISNIPELFCVNLPPSITIIDNKKDIKIDTLIAKKDIKINTKANSSLNIEVDEDKNGRVNRRKNRSE